MAGLDVTHKAQIHVEDTERFRAIGNPVSTIVAELLDFFLEYHKDEKWGFVGAPLHDPCTIARLLKPSCLPLLSAGLAWKHRGNIPGDDGC